MSSNPSTNGTQPAAELGSEESISSSSLGGAEPSEEEIQRKPWKFVGYKGYTNFISTDDSLFILRRFNSLNIRVALALQDEVSVLEEKLNILDKRYSRKES
ncbi:hypothetical protein VHEMI02578 [[Torrubiella] hemipterigena]|uniref:DUF6594 domain-containing protein n=1 Tax=[Torrubiella] hemipterigena TaxID=1531966 RepID=A0A0A1SQ05_9HYPO|nr:hypothetical protein VHEMI02578 [[Torrubiella] hemipterigena]